MRTARGLEDIHVGPTTIEDGLALAVAYLVVGATASTVDSGDRAAGAGVEDIVAIAGAREDVAAGAAHQGGHAGVARDDVVAVTAVDRKHRAVVAADLSLRPHLRDIIPVAQGEIPWHIAGNGQAVVASARRHRDVEASRRADVDPDRVVAAVGVQRELAEIAVGLVEDHTISGHDHDMVSRRAAELACRDGFGDAVVAHGTLDVDARLPRAVIAIGCGVDVNDGRCRHEGA